MKTLVELEREACVMPLHHDVNLQPVNAACEKCGGQLFIDTRIVLSSYPPKNMYICKACGNVETSYLVLPCKVGDKIFELVPKCKPPFGVCLFEGGLGMARCDNRRCKAYIQDRAFCLDDLYEIGKTVFLTREEAEEAMEQNND